MILTDLSNGVRGKGTEGEKREMKARGGEGSREKKRGSRAGKNLKTPILSVSLIENISVKKPCKRTFV